MGSVSAGATSSVLGRATISTPRWWAGSAARSSALSSATPCSLDTDDCPSGFACADIGNGDGTGVCNFSDDGGCCSTGDQDGQGPFVGIGLGAIGLGLVVSRRRRRK